MQTYATLNTNGNGYWSQQAKAVRITGLYMQYITPEKDFGELCVQFNTEDWDTSKDGLIYTDKQFMTELRTYLDSIGLDGADVSYSEQGMQGDDYVSCDVGAKFIASLELKDPAHIRAIWEECLDI